jgi:hypothetical protein
VTPAVGVLSRPYGDVGQPKAANPSLIEVRINAVGVFDRLTAAGTDTGLGMDYFKAMVALGAAVTLAGLSACNGAGTSASSSGPADVADASAPLPVRQFTKQAFVEYADGKTKAQIRAEFGKPDGVSSAYPDTWTYSIFNPTLQVGDPDAGVRATVDIQFEGDENASKDVVVAVNY